MAARPGEDNVATLFGDIHYFYGLPTQKPPHHRFDKSSYIYLFEDANQGRARVEIANNPGTDDQDAFDGYLDSVHLRYSYKQTCVVGLTVGDVGGQDEWHLPTYDPHNQNKYHYKLHSLDIYFWTQQDALQFVNAIRRVLPPNQCEVLDEPGPPPRHATEMSSVVQKLENAAISDAASKQTERNGNGSAAESLSFAPPPLSAVSGGDPSSPQSFVPMAYNPAAPAAPEQIRPREKTPPPEDGGLNPLHQTLADDYTATPFSPGLGPSGSGPLSPAVPPPQFQPPPGAPTFPGPPQHGVASPGLPPQGFGSLGGAAHQPPSSTPSPHPALARSSTLPATHGMASPGLASPYGPGAFPASPGYLPAQHTPTPPNLASPGLSHPPPPPPPQSGGGGFSQYAYAHHPGAGGAGQPMDYSIHQQAYRPAEGDGTGQYRPKQEVRGRLEENAGRLERGVTGMLKKFEKKFG